MTPEERAAKIVADGQWIAADYYTDESGEECRQEVMNATLLEREIADAIRAAEAALAEVAEKSIDDARALERERCAAICKAVARQSVGSSLADGLTTAAEWILSKGPEDQ